MDENGLPTLDEISFLPIGDRFEARWKPDEDSRPFLGFGSTKELATAHLIRTIASRRAAYAGYAEQRSQYHAERRLFVPPQKMIVDPRKNEYPVDELVRLVLPPTHELPQQPSTIRDPVRRFISLGYHAVTLFAAQHLLIRDGDSEIRETDRLVQYTRRALDAGLRTEMIFYTLRTEAERDRR